MLKLIWRMATIWTHSRKASDRAECARWRADPLSHPALRRMSARELADLPIGHPAAPCGRFMPDGC